MFSPTTLSFSVIPALKSVNFFIDWSTASLEVSSTKPLASSFALLRLSSFNLGGQVGMTYNMN